MLPSPNARGKRIMVRKTRQAGRRVLQAFRRSYFENLQIQTVKTATEPLQVKGLDLLHGRLLMNGGMLEKRWPSMPRPSTGYCLMFGLKRESDGAARAASPPAVRLSACVTGRRNDRVRRPAPQFRCEVAQQN